MFFRRKSLTLASLDERLSVVEIALGINRTETPREPPITGNGLDAALSRLHRAILRDTAGTSHARTDVK